MCAKKYIKLILTICGCFQSCAMMGLQATAGKRKLEGGVGCMEFHMDLGESPSKLGRVDGSWWAMDDSYGSPLNQTSTSYYEVEMSSPCLQTTNPCQPSATSSSQSQQQQQQSQQHSSQHHSSSQSSQQVQQQQQQQQQQSSSDYLAVANSPASSPRYLSAAATSSTSTSPRPTSSTAATLVLSGCPSNMMELQVDIADSQQPLNLSKKSPSPSPSPRPLVGPCKALSLEA